MRLTVILVALSGWLFAADPASAIVACPISDFVLHYNDSDGAGLNEDQLDTIHAAVARARQCEVQSIEVLPTSSAADQPLWRRRVEVLRDELIFGGIDETLIRVTTSDKSERPTWAGNVSGDAVVVTIWFR
jgi:hypothetical protein